QASQAVYYLKQQSIARIDVVNYITHGIHKVSGHSDHSQDSGHGHEQQDEESIGGESSSQSPLENYAVNLNEQATQGRIDPLVGRVLEVERVCQILSRRRNNNPMLVGESGVGKTAFAASPANINDVGDFPVF